MGRKRQTDNGAFFRLEEFRYDIANVDQSGIVTPRSQGFVTIQAAMDGKFDVFTIRVIRASLASITLSIDPSTVVVGRKVRILANAIDSTGKAATTVSLNWRSSAPEVARFEESAKADRTGLVSLLRTGTARIDAFVEGITGSITINVLPLPALHFKSVSSNLTTSCALTVEGAAYCWGTDLFGSLGAGVEPPLDVCPNGYRCAASPIPVIGDHVFSDLSSGFGGHMCALANDGAYCWGDDRAGEIGDGPDFVLSAPSKVKSSATYASLSTGDHVSCGVTTTKAIDCWGSNDNGELGDSTVTETCPRLTSNGRAFVCSSAPHRVPGSVEFDKVSVGFSHVCALSKDGIAYCWGSSRDGSLGSIPASQCGDFPCNKVPTQVVTDLRFTDISAGYGFTCGVGKDNRAYCWGRDDFGQLGIGTFNGADAPYPGAVSTSQSFVRVFAGSTHACALTSDGRAFCWGQNNSGSIGDGSTQSRALPSLVGQSGSPAFTSLSPGAFHTCGFQSNGFVACWGDNSYRQLGTGFDSSASIPLKVAGQ